MRLHSNIGPDHIIPTTAIETTATTTMGIIYVTVEREGECTHVRATHGDRTTFHKVFTKPIQPAHDPKALEHMLTELFEGQVYNATSEFRSLLKVLTSYGNTYKVTTIGLSEAEDAAVKRAVDAREDATFLVAA